MSVHGCILCGKCGKGPCPICYPQAHSECKPTYELGQWGQPYLKQEKPLIVPMNEIEYRREVLQLLNASIALQGAQGETLAVAVKSLAETEQRAQINSLGQTNAILGKLADAWSDIGLELKHQRVAVSDFQRETNTILETVLERVAAVEARLAQPNVLYESIQAQINQLFKRQDESKKYIIEALQAADFYQRKRFDELTELMGRRFDMQDKDLIALANIADEQKRWALRVPKQAIAKPTHLSRRPVTPRKRKR